MRLGCTGTDTRSLSLGAAPGGHSENCPLLFLPVDPLAGLLFGVRLSLGERTKRSRSAKVDALASLPEPMKIASFNINNINRRLTNLLNWLRETEPDIVCVQETKAADADFPAEAIRQAAITRPGAARGAGTAWRSSRGGLPL
jgi:hypothetical protein